MRTIEAMGQTTASSIEREHHLLRLYGELMALSPSLAGRLVCAIGKGVAATGITLAASIAGAASIVCDPDEVAVKACMRQGSPDFVVRTLDEAVRIAKNEVRRGRAVSVGLIADPSAVAQEMNERGLVADVYGRLSQQDEVLVRAKSTVLLDADSESPGLAALLAEHRWQARSVAPDLLPEITDSIRRNWLQGLPKYQHTRRDAARAIWLNDAEYASATNPAR